MSERQPRPEIEASPPQLRDEVELKPEDLYHPQTGRFIGEASPVDRWLAASSPSVPATLEPREAGTQRKVIPKEKKDAEDTD